MYSNYYDTEQTDVKMPIPTDDKYPLYPGDDSRYDRLKFTNTLWNHTVTSNHIMYSFHSILNTVG